MARRCGSAKCSRTMSALEIPLFPLRTVLFPGAVQLTGPLERLQDVLEILPRLQSDQGNPDPCRTCLE